MGSRDYKPNYPNAYFHVYNRGVKKDTIFFDDQDYENFIYRAKILLGIVPVPKRSAKGGIRLSVLPKGAFEVISYCLMPNHFHFLIKQCDINAMTKFFHRLCSSYSVFFNKKYSRVGHVFQDIFKCKNVLDDDYLTQLTGYIHMNPLEPFSWRHSSLAEYLGESGHGLAKPQMLFDMHKLNPSSYKDFLLKQYNPSILEDVDLLFEDP